MQIMISNFYAVNFDTLMAETYPSIFRFALRLSRNEETARDLCQETFIRAHRSQTWRELDRNPLPWLNKIVRNCFLDYKRMLSRRPIVTSFDFNDQDGRQADFVDHRDNPEQALLREQISLEIQQAIRSMPRINQELIKLSLIERVPYAEMAIIYSCSVPTMRSRVHRAVGNLRKKLKEMEPDMFSDSTNGLVENSPLSKVRGLE